MRAARSRPDHGAARVRSRHRRITARRHDVEAGPDQEARFEWEESQRHERQDGVRGLLNGLRPAAKASAAEDLALHFGLNGGS